jgi:predicted CXXCH cytochrome family protein
LDNCKKLVNQFSLNNNYASIMERRKNLKYKLLVVMCALLLASAGLLVAFNTAAAKAINPVQALQQTENEDCFACHSEPGQTTVLPSGELLYISVDPDTYANSIHGNQGLACIQCHTDIRGYPHPPIQSSTRREYSHEQYPICESCHGEAYEVATNDAHLQAIERGNLEAAVCADCHGAHDIQSPRQPRSQIPQTCQRCHSQIYSAYKDSVHGSDLIGEGNPDVPSCVDCHNAHNVQGPTNSAFRLFSPDICKRCHADPELMGRYGVRADVFDTYVADFHGTTVQIFQAVAPGQQPNQAVCADCHGVHDIARVDDPDSPVIKENLLATCQRCHPDATADFPGAWLAHYTPGPQHYPLVFYARLFYTILIPGLIGGMAIFVAGDIGRRISLRRKEKHDA